MKNRKRVIILGLCAALTVGAVGGAWALFTAVSQVKENQFTVAKGGGGDSKKPVIEEPEWENEDKEDIQPGATLKKDPYVTNNEGYEAWVYMDVVIPAASQVDQLTSAIKDAGGNTVESKTPLLTLNDTTGWTLIGKDDKTTDGKILLVYAYDTPLAPGAKTATPCFSSFTLMDWSKYQSNANLSIDITARLVQSDSSVEPLLDQYQDLFGGFNSNLVAP